MRRGSHPVACRHALATGLALLVALATTGARASEATGPTEPDALELVLAPYALLASIDGDVGLGRVDEVGVEVDFGDILEALELAAMVHAELWYGDWGLVGDVAYMKLGDDLSGPRGGVADAELQQTVWEAFVSRRFDVGAGQLDAFAGARIWDLDVDVELELPRTETGGKRSKGWVDPVVGARGLYPVWEELFATLRFDIGGFGAGSNFSWRAGAGLGYDFNDLFALSVQYVALGVDYEDGAKGSPGYFRYDTITHGPLLGFIFRI